MEWLRCLDQGHSRMRAKRFCSVSLHSFHFSAEAELSMGERPSYSSPFPSPSTTQMKQIHTVIRNGSFSPIHGIGWNPLPTLALESPHEQGKTHPFPESPSPRTLPSLVASGLMIKAPSHTERDRCEWKGQILINSIANFVEGSCPLHLWLSLWDRRVIFPIVRRLRRR